MPAKRDREEACCGWQMLFPNAAALLSIVHAISNLSSRVFFHVDRDGMCTQAVASAKSCMVTAKLRCSVTGVGDTGQTLCVDATTLLRALRAVHHTQALRLSGSDDDDNLTVRASDELTRACQMQWCIPTLVDDAYQVQLDDISYAGEWVYDTLTLKHDLRRCRDMEGTDALRVRLLGTQDGGVMRRCVELSCSGDRGSVTVQHHSATSAEDGVQGAVTDGAAPQDLEGYTLMFRQTYAFENLVDFLKAVDHPTVKLLLGEDQPLIVEVGLNADGSSITFVQGPQVDDDDAA